MLDTNRGRVQKLSERKIIKITYCLPHTAYINMSNAKIM